MKDVDRVSKAFDIAVLRGIILCSVIAVLFFLPVLAYNVLPIACDSLSETCFSERFSFYEIRLLGVMLSYTVISLIMFFAVLLVSAVYKTVNFLLKGVLKNHLPFLSGTLAALCLLSVSVIAQEVIETLFSVDSYIVPNYSLYMTTMLSLLFVWIFILEIHSRAH